MTDEELDKQGPDGAARHLREWVGGAAGAGGGVAAVTHHGTECGRVRALGRTIDDGRRGELLVVWEQDGSWTFRAPARGVTLSRSEALFIAESIIERGWGEGRWYQQSVGGSVVAHRGTVGGFVAAVCGARFEPAPRLGRLSVPYAYACLGQVCAVCAAAGPDGRWCDACGVPIPDGCRVEQIAVATGHGVLPARVPKRGRVTGRGAGGVTVRFDGEAEAASVGPHLLRVLDGPGS